MPNTVIEENGKMLRLEIPKSATRETMFYIAMPNVRQGETILVTSGTHNRQHSAIVINNQDIADLIDLLQKLEAEIQG